VEESHPSPSESVGEDGWASDGSDTRAPRPTRTKSLGGKRTLASKYGGSKKRPSTADTPNISPEYSRTRRDRSRTPSPPRYSWGGTGLPVSRTTSWDLNSPNHSRPGSVYFTDSRRGSVRNLRIESLRTAGMPGSPRELSPARSVRFADTHPPRTPLPFQDASAAGTSHLGHGDKDQDSSRNPKVAFDLPDEKA
jgi:hypothetical protein